MTDEQIERGKTISYEHGYCNGYEQGISDFSWIQFASQKEMTKKLVEFHTKIRSLQNDNWDLKSKLKELLETKERKSDV